MDRIYEIIETIGYTNLIYIVAGIIVFIIICMLFKELKLKSYKNKIENIEEKMNGIKSLPLQYRLGRVHSISKNMPEILPRYEEFLDEFQRIVSFQKNELAVAINEVDELVFYKKTRKVSKRIKNIIVLLNQYENDSKKLLQSMEEITEVENIQRVEIIKIKEIYRQHIDVFEKMRYKVEDYVPDIIHYFDEIDDGFVHLESLMNNQRFQEASDSTENIKNKVEWLGSILEDLPNYVVLVRKIIPQKINDSQKIIDTMKSENYSLDKLDVLPRLDVIKGDLDESIKKVKSLTFDGLDECLKKIFDDIEALNLELNTEIASYQQFKDVMKNAYNYVTQMYSEYKTCMSSYSKMKDYFVLDDYNIDIENHFNDLEMIVKDMNELEAVIKTNDFGYTKTLAKLSDIRTRTQSHSQFIKDFNHQKEELYIKKQRADDELENINIVLLEIKSQIKNKHLPMINDSYKDFIADARKLSLEILEYKQQKPVDLNILSKKVDEARDIIYKLYDNVNNLIKTVNMVEEAIVFGNRYRYDFLEVNTELTKAEVLFRNGEYTKALTTVVDIIEKIKPGSYEELIKKSEKKS